MEACSTLERFKTQWVASLVEYDDYTLKEYCHIKFLFMAIINFLVKFLHLFT